VALVDGGRRICHVSADVLAWKLLLAGSQRSRTRVLGSGVRLSELGNGRH